MNAVSIISLVFSGVMLAVSVITFVVNGIRQAKKKEKDDVTELSSIRESLLKVNMKLDQVCATTNETRTDIKAITKDVSEIDKRVTKIEGDLETAFMRIDELREEIRTHE